MVRPNRYARTRYRAPKRRARSISRDGYWSCAIRTYLAEVKSSGYTARDRYKVCFIDYAPPSAPWVADRATSAPDGISSKPYIYTHTQPRTPSTTMPPPSPTHTHTLHTHPCDAVFATVRSVHNVLDTEQKFL
jgi:hypothetical protein